TTQLAISRALDGLGNAAVGPLALVLVMSLFPDDQRPRAIALFLGLSPLGAPPGPSRRGRGSRAPACGPRPGGPPSAPPRGAVAECGYSRPRLAAANGAGSMGSVAS